MPELPEVQTIVNDLQKKIKGEIVASFWSDWRKGIKGGYENFSKKISGKKILNVARIGKNILVNLSGGQTVIVHLRMTGALIMQHATHNMKHDRHVHHIFYFVSGKRLEFSDIRKFGSLELVNTNNLKKSESMKKLGIDALSPDLTLEEFDKILENSKTKIKQLLLNQERIAGIGNIYASEILFDAEILPDRTAESLKKSERKKLFQAIRKILKKAVQLRGTSISDYRDASGERGKFQNYLKVYGRAGQNCPSCDTIIRRSVHGQRSTFHCSECQK